MQKQAAFAEAKALKYPEQIAIAIARNGRDKYNPITLGWAMQTSHEPPMWAISVGRTRYSCEVIRQAREFVLALPSERQENETMLFGTQSGRNVDKLCESGTRTRPAARIDGVLLEDAVANFECRVVGELDSGDHVLFLGEVLASYVHETPLNRLYTVAPGHQLGGLPRG
jgi:flavin reductase (DIM6/NTAB) family NADH-FMN oxidoreductase RutF